MTDAPFLPPGLAPEHAVLEKDVGTWDVSLEIRPGPGEPQISKGVAVGRLISGGRWLLVDFKNETSDFEGHGVYGWDRAKGCYVGTWVDDMRPFLATSNGTWNRETRTMAWLTVVPGPGGSVMTLRETMQSVDPQTQIFRSYIPTPGGGEFEMITATYKRR